MRVRAGQAPRLRPGGHYRSGEEDRIREVASANPLDFLGRRTNPAGGNDGRGQGTWSYDSRARELRYQPRSPGLIAEPGGFRWRYVARTDSAGRVVGAGLEAIN